MRRADQDAAADGLALIEALHRRDLEAMAVLLDNGDNRLMAVFLARVADDLIGDLSEWCRLEPPAMFARLREHHAGG